jgi:hypothetical protein
MSDRLRAGVLTPVPTGQPIGIGRTRDSPTIRSGGAAFVVMVQSADVWDLHDRARARRLHWTGDRRVFVECEVGAPRVVVGEVLPKIPAKRALVPDDDVVETFAPQKADQALYERILPRRVWRDQDLFEAHRFCGSADIRPVDGVAIPEAEARRRVAGPGLAKLLSGPGRGGMGGDVDVDDAPSLVREHDEDEQDPESGRRNGEEVDRRELGDVIGEEGTPSL